MAVDKLVDSSALDTNLTSVANAIRTKGGTSAQLAFPTGFVSAINAIQTGSTGATVAEKDLYMGNMEEYTSPTMFYDDWLVIKSTTQSQEYRPDTGYGYYVDIPFYSSASTGGLRSFSLDMVLIPRSGSHSYAGTCTFNLLWVYEGTKTVGRLNKPYGHFVASSPNSNAWSYSIYSGALKFITISNYDASLPEYTGGSGGGGGISL